MPELHDSANAGSSSPPLSSFPPSPPNLLPIPSSSTILPLVPLLQITPMAYLPPQDDRSHTNFLFNSTPLPPFLPPSPPPSQASEVLLQIKPCRCLALLLLQVKNDLVFLDAKRSVIDFIVEPLDYQKMGLEGGTNGGKDGGTEGRRDGGREG